MVNGGLGHPQGTVIVCSITHAAVTQVEQMLVVETAAGQDEIVVGGVVRVCDNEGELVLAREEEERDEDAEEGDEEVNAGGFPCAWTVLAKTTRAAAVRVVRRGIMITRE